MSERSDNPELEGPINDCKTRKVSLGPALSNNMNNLEGGNRGANEDSDLNCESSLANNVVVVVAG